jgi:hypothetical protein
MASDLPERQSLSAHQAAAAIHSFALHKKTGHRSLLEGPMAGSGKLVFEY